MQKFNKGDHVRVVKDLGESMRHFKSDYEAIVIGSYADQFGGDGTNIYTIFIKNRGEVSWYYENQLQLIGAGRQDLLEKWTTEKDADRKQRSDLDWIFDNGKEVAQTYGGPSTEALAECLGCNNLWGSCGEGFVYYNNALCVMEIAKPFLVSGDKKGWLEYCEKIKHGDH